MKTEEAPHLTGINPSKTQKYCARENIPMLSSHLAYCRYSVLLLRCSTMDLVMVFEVIIFLNYYNRSELYQKKKKKSWIFWFLSFILLVSFLLLPFQTHTKFKNNLNVFRWLYARKAKQTKSHKNKQDNKTQNTATKTSHWIEYFRIQQHRMHI